MLFRHATQVQAYHLGTRQEMPSASGRAPPRRRKWVRSGTAHGSSNIRTRPTHENFPASLLTGLVLAAPAGAFLQRLDRISRNLPRNIEQGCAIGEQGVHAFEVDGALDFRKLHRRTRP